MITKKLPEEIVTAVLYQVGENVRIEDDQQFTDIFDETARSVGGEFSQFRAHPQYRFSKTLDSTIQNMMLGGGIIREGLSKYIRASPHTLGHYGERIFQDLDGDVRKIICEMAKKIQDAYPLANKNQN